MSNRSDDKPVLAITLGDVAGIGPEVVAKALARPDVRAIAHNVVIGNAPALNKAFALVGAGLRARAVAAPDEACEDGVIPVVEAWGDATLAELPYGQVSAEAGRASVEWVIAAGRFALDGRVGGMVTAPMNKESAELAGCKEVGALEILEKLTGAEDVATVLIADKLRVCHLTTHHSLRVACDYVTKANILGKLRLTHDFFLRYEGRAPSIGVAALNPHAGEAGLLGREEIEEIRPAVEAAKAEGIAAEGPIPADSLFPQASRGKYDAVLAMYHDQGHIPVKVHGWESSIALLLGLPFVRTSVDHGTAFDIAGKGIADSTGMVNAIVAAASMVAQGRLSG